MTEAFKIAVPGVECETRSWMNKSPIPEGAFVLGHSFGAYRAWERCKSSNRHEFLITVDFRWWTKNRHYEREGLGLQINFFQVKPLKGYRLSALFTNINLGAYGHMNAPSHPKVIQSIRDIWKRVIK
jgi:hypothetical protein